MKDAPRLSRNEDLVLSALRTEGCPQTAYQLLDRLRGEGLKAPLQIYRALRSLSDRHLVHRLESMNAFMACNHQHVDHSHAAVFAICRECGRVDELTDDLLDQALKVLAAGSGFSLENSAVEMHGLCLDCGAKGGVGKPSKSDDVQRA